MGTITVSLPADGTTADVADYNTPITTIVNAINGGLDNANIVAGAAIAGSKLANSSVAAGKLDFGGSGVGVWWEEIGRTTLSVAGDTISVTSIPARKYLMFRIEIIETGAVTGVIRFNNDSGSNYAWRASYNGAADSTAVSTTALTIFSESSAFVQLNGNILNVSTKEKLCYCTLISNGATGAGSNTVRGEFSGKWTNTTDLISRIDIINTNTGDFAIGSELVVLGHN